MDGLYYVLLFIPEGDIDYSRNLWKIDKVGNVIWKVKFDGTEGFSGFKLEDSKLIAYSGGCSFIVNSQSGAVSFLEMKW